VSSPQSYANDHSRLLDKLSQQADAHVAQAMQWGEQLAASKAEAETAEQAFLSDFSSSNARALAEAKNHVRDLSHLAEAVENVGGAQYVRTRYLRSPLVFSSLAKGFAERIDVLNTLVKPAAKRLGERRAAMTEAGVHFALVEADPITAVLREYGESITRALAAATFGKMYSDKRGVGHELRSFDSLFGDLTAPLPQAPSIPTA